MYDSEGGWRARTSIRYTRPDSQGPTEARDLDSLQIWTYLVLRAVGPSSLPTWDNLLQIFQSVPDLTVTRLSPDQFLFIATAVHHSTSIYFFLPRYLTSSYLD
jgi:hypothetical protein